jgi:hypothetical protein
MNKSESITKIASALCEMQSNPIIIGVNASGYGYDYATLDKVISRIMPVATKHGLSVAQPLGEVNGEPVIHTLLMHSSGQWVESSYPLEKAGIGKANDAQQFGAAVTYARRYGLLSLFGVPVGKDDDANSLTEEPKAKRATGKKYKETDNTPIDDLIQKMHGCESIHALDDLVSSNKKMILDSGKRDQVTAEYQVLVGTLGGKS